MSLPIDPMRPDRGEPFRPSQAGRSENVPESVLKGQAVDPIARDPLEMPAQTKQMPSRGYHSHRS